MRWLILVAFVILVLDAVLVLCAWCRSRPRRTVALNGEARIVRRPA